MQKKERTLLLLKYNCCFTDHRIDTMAHPRPDTLGHSQRLPVYTQSMLLSFKARTSHYSKRPPRVKPGTDTPTRPAKRAKTETAATATTGGAPEWLEASNGSIVRQGYEPRICNVVANGRLVICDCDGQEIVDSAIDTKLLADTMFGRHGSSDFPASILNLKLPKGTINIFTSKKVAFVGFRCIMSVYLAIGALLRHANRSLPASMTQQGQGFRLRDLKIVNSSSTTRLGFALDLPRIHSIFNGKSNYNPVDYPALVMHLSVEGNRVAVCFYGSGSIVCTGARSHTDMKAIFDQVIPFAEQFRLE